MVDRKLIPYGRQSITEDDIKSVVEVLRSEWLTTGPKVEEFEAAVATYVGARHAVAVSSGTAALHAAMFALGIGSGDEVIVPPMTFAATANCILYQGGTPVFVDVEESTLLIDPNKIVEKISPKTKAIIGVDYAGQPCDWDALREIADRHNLHLVDDGCHALGAEYKGKKVGTLADLTIFSFHPVKHITTGEGGMIMTDNSDLAEKMRRFRNHGIDTDHRQRAEKGTWYYEMVELGYNYRISDFQCALGLSQLKKLPSWIKRRQELAVIYNDDFSGYEIVKPLSVLPDITHARHLYVVRLNLKKLTMSKQELFEGLRSSGVGVNVHYIPVHLHPFYRNKFKTNEGMCTVSEKVFYEILSLPIFPVMKNSDVKNIVHKIKSLIGGV